MNMIRMFLTGSEMTLRYEHVKYDGQLDAQLDIFSACDSSLFVTADDPHEIQQEFAETACIITPTQSLARSLVPSRVKGHRVIILDGRDSNMVMQKRLIPLLHARAGLLTAQNNIKPAKVLPELVRISKANPTGGIERIISRMVDKFSDIDDEKLRLIRILNTAIIEAGGDVHASRIESKDRMIQTLCSILDGPTYFRIWNTLKTEGIIMYCADPDAFRHFQATTVSHHIPEVRPDTRTNRHVQEFERHATKEEKDILRNTISGNESEIGLLWAQIWHASRTDHNVVLRGESGTGKELAAECIHELLKIRAENPRNGNMLAVNAAAIPLELFDGEFFGLDMAAGLHVERPGHFVVANHGTLFLDEIGDLRMEHQAKLLRSIESRTVLPVGAANPIAFDVKIICATHKDLEALVRAKKFREDLFYRLDEVTVYTIPLNRMRSSITDIAKALLERITEADTISFDQDALSYLSRHDWSGGNVRALRRLIIRTWTTFYSSISASAVIKLEHILAAEQTFDMSGERQREHESPPSLLEIISNLHDVSEKLQKITAKPAMANEVSSRDLGELQSLLRQMLSSCTTQESQPLRTHLGFMETEALVLPRELTTPSEFDNFMKAMEEIHAAVDMLGSKVHASYVEIVRERYGDREISTWDALSEEKKRSNILQLIHMPQFFMARGYALRVVNNREIEVMALREKDVLHIAKAEHRRWKQEVSSQGWTWGERRDDARKINPNIVSWNTLDERARELTLSSVRIFPHLMKSIGVEIYRKG